MRLSEPTRVGWRARAAAAAAIACVLLALLAGSAQARIVTPVSLGSNQTSSPSSSSLSVTTTQALPAGTTIVVTAGSSEFFAGCSDSGGDAGKLAFGADDMTLCVIAAIPSELPSGSTITATWMSTGTSELVEAFAISGIQANPSASISTNAETNGSPSVFPLSPLSNVLLFGGVEDVTDSAAAAGFSPGTNGTSNPCWSTGTPTYTSLGGIDMAGSAPSFFPMYCAVSATGSYALSASLGDPSAAWGAALMDLALTVTTSSTALVSSQDPSPSGQPVTFTATVTGDAPTGTVDFEDGGTTISGCGAEPVGSDGTATCTTSALTAGTHTITAAYGGDPTDTPSTSPSLTQSIEAPTTTTVLSCNRYFNASFKRAFRTAFERAFKSAFKAGFRTGHGPLTRAAGATAVPASCAGAAELGSKRGSSIGRRKGHKAGRAAGRRHRRHGR